MCMCVCVGNSWGVTVSHMTVLLGFNSILVLIDFVELCPDLKAPIDSKLLD